MSGPAATRKTLVTDELAGNPSITRPVTVAIAPVWPSGHRRWKLGTIVALGLRAASTHLRHARTDPARSSRKGTRSERRTDHAAARHDRGRALPVPRGAPPGGGRRGRGGEGQVGGEGAR